MARKNFWTKRTVETLIYIYNFVSSPNDIFVSCQHTTIKVSKRCGFQGSFSSGFDHFSPAVFFFNPVSNATYLFDYWVMKWFFSCGPLRKQPSHPRESTSGSSKVSSRGLIPFSNTYHKRICIILFENNRYKSLALNMWMLCQHQNIRLIMY